MKQLVQIVLMLVLLVAWVQSQYSCQLANNGLRIQETNSRTPYDCFDANCQSTCKGGQCVAYVKCRCTKDGKYVPSTSCWKPGTKIVNPDGKCNGGIPTNTAIATFSSHGQYYGHAAVFIGCESDFKIKVHDQWCCRSTGYSIYDSTHKYYNQYAVITTPSCTGPPSWPCREEQGGATCCNKDSQCKKHNSFYEMFMAKSNEQL